MFLVFPRLGLGFAVGGVLGFSVGCYVLAVAFGVGVGVGVGFNCGFRVGVGCGLGCWQHGTRQSSGGAMVAWRRNGCLASRWIALTQQRRYDGCLTCL